jgi:hypothetical protein
MRTKVQWVEADSGYWVGWTESGERLPFVIFDGGRRISGDGNSGYYAVKEGDFEGRCFREVTHWQSARAAAESLSEESLLHTRVANFLRAGFEAHAVDDVGAGMIAVLQCPECMPRWSVHCGAGPSHGNRCSRVGWQAGGGL